MPDSNPDDALLLIRCPSCGQRFKVGDDLMGRTVECGGCEHRFRIEDEVVVRGKKFYPGERKDPSLDRYQRVPLAMSGPAADQQAVRYAEAPDPLEFEPVAPQRIIAGIAGVAAMVLMALLLMFGATTGGSLDGMPTVNRLVMAGFTGVIGCVALLYANPKGRVKALTWGGLFMAALLALPFVFTEGSVPLESSTPVVESNEPAVEEPEASPAEKSIADLRARIGTGPLEDEIERLAAADSDKHAVGLWMRDLSVEHRLLVRDYMLRVTNADPASHFYPRGDRDFLMVVTGISQSLDEVGRAARALGKVTKVYPELSVIEVLLDNQRFVEGSLEKLLDRSDPAFYDLNKRELESVDVDRIEKAVKRLAEAEPSVYRSDISRKMIELLGEDWVEFKDALCVALMVWSEEPGPAGQAALNQVLELRRREANVPEEMIALIVKEKNPAVLPVIDGLWMESPGRWENLYAELGSVAEAPILQRFPAARGSNRHSAVRLLGRVGGAASLPVLESAREGADSELKVLIEHSVASITARAER